MKQTKTTLPVVYSANFVILTFVFFGNEMLLVRLCAASPAAPGATVPAAHSSYATRASVWVLAALALGFDVTITPFWERSVKMMK